jgi:23S rRNA (pseudouridine1915-N3)-methyltransferase
LQPISPGKRGKGVASSAAIASECRDLLANVTAQDWVVLLDEDGRQESSVEIASRLAEWQQSGRNIVFVIGGPDGVSDEMRKRADHCWSLSALTLPHGLARVVFAEQLYRCWSIAEGHPYHRD